MSSDRPITFRDVRALRRFSGDELQDDARAFSSDAPEAIKSFKQLNAEQNRIYPLDMRDFRRLEDLPIPAWKADLRRITSVDTLRVVYFVQAIDGGPIKIGTSAVGSILTRFTTIQVSHPFELRIRRLVAGDWRVERGLHSYFAAQQTRDRGEWFWPNDELEEIAEPRSDPGRWIRL
jgi:hypothetical protein